jgi:hypothetical protein
VHVHLVRLFFKPVYKIDKFIWNIILNNQIAIERFAKFFLSIQTQIVFRFRLNIRVVKKSYQLFVRIIGFKAGEKVVAIDRATNVYEHILEYAKSGKKTSRKKRQIMQD